MNVEEYANYLRDIKQSPYNGDFYDELVRKPELRGKTLAEMKEMAAKNLPRARQYADNFAKYSHSDTSDLKYKSSAGWERFIINKDPHSGSIRDKGYLTLKDGLTLTPKTFENFAQALQAAGFKGQLKVPSIGSRMATGYDNIVLHGSTKNDVSIGIQVGKQFFGTQIQQIQVGQDIGNRSRTDLLADALKQLHKSL